MLRASLREARNTFIPILVFPAALPGTKEKPFLKRNGFL